MNFKIKTIVNSGFGTNTYILSSKNKAIVIDPGRDSDLIIGYLENNNIQPCLILCTHGHYDHVEGVYPVKKKYSTEFRMHKNDEELYMSPNNIGDYNFEKINIDNYLSNNDYILLNDIKFKVMHTPGHTKGSISLYRYPNLFSGDIIFSNSIGRTDLPGGDYDILINSIKTKVLTLPEEVVIYPGHMSKTTVENEKYNNPYLQ